MNPILFAIPVFLLTIVLEAWWARRRGLAVYDIPDAVTSLHHGVLSQLGVLDRILVTPSNHRVHHGQNDYCIDKNYGGILILWDRLFGTFEDERDGEKIVYGIRKPLKSYSPIWGNLHYYADLWRESVAAQGWRAKVGVWVAPPGGWTDEPIAHFEPATFQRYTRQTPAAMRWYVALQYALLVPLVVHFLGIVKDIPTADALVYAGVIAFTAVALGALLEGLPWGRWLEMLRLLAVGAVFALLPDWFGFQAPVALRAAVLVFAVASVVWLLRRRTALGQVAA